MRRYRANSYSAQAREIANKLYNEYRYYTENPDKAIELTFESPIRFVNDKVVGGERYTLMSNDVRVYEKIIQSSYRATLIKDRVAKRFGRLIRKGK